MGCSEKEAEHWEETGRLFWVVEILGCQKYYTIGSYWSVEMAAPLDSPRGLHVSSFILCVRQCLILFSRYIPGYKHSVCLHV
jgi:hypothetical protein